MPGEEGESPLFCQPLPGRPSQWAQPVPKHHGAVDGCPPQDFGPCIPLHVAGTRRPPRQTRLHHSMRAAIWFLLPSDGVIHRSSSSLQCYLTHQGWRVVLRGGDMTLPPLERYLNWVSETTPTPPRDHGKENLTPVEEPHKLPRKIRPRRRKKEHHQHPGAFGSLPGTSQSPSPVMSASVKHPQPFQGPQHPHSAANHNSAWPNLLNQAELGRL